MLHTVIRHMYVFSCAYVLCFTLKDWFHCQPIWGKAQFKSFKLHILGVRAPWQTQGAQGGLGPACSHRALLWNCISGKQKQLERWEFSYSSLEMRHGLESQMQIPTAGGVAGAES